MSDDTSVRTRAWEAEPGTSSTIVQVRDDAEPRVWLHTNIGWVGVSNAPEGYEEAERFAESMARGYGLAECSPARARFLAGLDGE